MEKTITLPKIKKVQLMNKVMIDPSDIKKGIPASTLPELNDQGIIISLVAQRAPLAKLSPDGTLKMTLKYSAEVIPLIDRYVQVRVKDSYDDLWIGDLFGVNVRGKGGQGDIRGCKVIAIQGQNIIVQAVSKAGNQLWAKLQTKVEAILSNPN